MEVPTIHKAYAFGLWFRGYSPNFYGLKYGTKRSSILGWVIPLDCGEVPRQLSSMDRWDVPSFGRSPIQYISHYCHIIYIIYVLPIANICNKLPYCRYCNRLPCCQCLMYFFRCHKIAIMHGSQKVVFNQQLNGDYNHQKRGIQQIVFQQEVY